MKKTIFMLLCIFSYYCTAMEDHEEFKWKMYSAVNSSVSSGVKESDTISEIARVLSGGGDINANLMDGFMVLHFAVLRNKLKLMMWLIDKGANPHIENCDGRTALDLAAGRGHPIYDPHEAPETVTILKKSKCTTFRPGMCRQDYEEVDNVLAKYKSVYGLDLKLGEQFKS